MPKNTTTSRKALFRAALALNETSVSKWAAENGISGSYVHIALGGYQGAVDLNAKIDAYIKQHMGRQIARAG